MDKTKTVLIVDDDGIFREALHDILTSAGFSVSCCHAGPSALEQSKRKCFQVIITDYHMGGMNGADMARELRVQCPDSLIIGISGEQKEKDFIEAGANTFFRKPFFPNELVSLIKTKLFP
jgi:CheY-like chemotaxis protein